VSTDSDIIRNKISEIKNDKLKIINRSEETATDTAPTELAMLEFAENNLFNEVILIQATSPLLKTQHLEEGINKYDQSDCDSLLSLVRQKKFIWDRKGDQFKSINYNPLNRPMRQEFKGILTENGAFYITSRERLLKTKCRISGKIEGYEMPEENYFDLDEPLEWLIIELLLKKR